MRALFFTILARVRAFLRPAAGDADFDQELETHLAMAEQDNVRRGMSPERARREARLELGGVTQLREAAREARGLPWLETFWLDARLGLRMLRRSWGLTLVGGLAIRMWTWVAPALGYLPVKAERIRKSKVEFTLRIESVDK